MQCQKTRHVWSPIGLYSLFLFFLLHVNELNSVGDEFGLTAYSYADDTTLYICFDP